MVLVFDELYRVYSLSLSTGVRPGEKYWNAICGPDRQPPPETYHGL